MDSRTPVCSSPTMASRFWESSVGHSGLTWVLHFDYCSGNFVVLEFVYGSSCTLGANVSGDLPFGTPKVPLFK